MPRGRTIRVASRDARFQRAQTLKLNRTKRRRAALCYVEGVLPINAALRSGNVASLWYAHDRPLSRWAREVLDGAASAERVELSAALLDELSDRGDGAEMAALVRIPVRTLDEIAPDNAVILVLDRPASPGNIGTAVRSAAGFDAVAVVIAGHAADPFDPKAIAASRGAVFEVPIIEIAGAAELAAWRDALPEGQRLLLACASASAAGSLPLQDAGLVPPLALVMGNEAAGLSQAFKDSCDLAVHIPIDTAVVDSLNAGVAAGIALYEVRRRLLSGR